MESKIVRSIPPWPLFQFLPPDTYNCYYPDFPQWWILTCMPNKSFLSKVSFDNDVSHSNKNLKDTLMWVDPYMCINSLYFIEPNLMIEMVVALSNIHLIKKKTKVLTDLMILFWSLYDFKQCSGIPAWVCLPLRLRCVPLFRGCLPMTGIRKHNAHPTKSPMLLIW